MVKFRRLCLALMSIVVLFVGMAGMPQTADAKPPLFHRARGAFTFGIELFNPVMGDFAKGSVLGLAAVGELSLQFGYFGAAVRFGAGPAFTKKEGIPFDQGYQLVYISAGPRFNLAPFRRQFVNFYVQPEVSLELLYANSLVRYTDNRHHFWAAGGVVGVQYLVGILVLGAHVSTRYMWDLQSLMISGGISIGIGSMFE